MKEFITDLGVIPNASGPIKLFRDNTGAIALAKEPRFHKKTRHIKRRFNSIRESVQNGSVQEGVLPMLQGVRLSSAQSPTSGVEREKMSGIPYASTVGSIMHAMLCTRPDVCLAISLARRYQSNPLESGQEHPEIPEKDYGYVSRLWR